jgi:quercetin dioxygenase-like cupin family protein
MRRTMFLGLFVLALAVPSVLAQDPTKVDSKHYKVEFENSKVRILRVHYGPHEKSVMHRHPDAIAIFQNDGKVKFTYPGGKTEEREMKAGQTLFTPAVRHLPENVTDNDMEVILIELKTAKRKPAAAKPASTSAPTNSNKQ